MTASPRPPAEVGVVIVDDHALFAQTLELALGHEGYDTSCVEFPEEAGGSSAPLLSTLLQMRPDVLLLDLDLGTHGDGHPLIEPATKAGIEVIVLTGAEEPGQWARAVMSGAAKVISKSRPLAEVISTVRRLVAGEVVMSNAERSALLEAWVHRRANNEALWTRFDLLSMRESDVLGMLMQGHPVRDIARHAHTAEGTVRTQVKAILGKLEVSSQLAAVGLAYQIGWRAPFQQPLEE